MQEGQAGVHRHASPWLQSTYTHDNCRPLLSLAQLMLSTLTLLPLTPTFSYLFKKKKKKKKKKKEFFKQFFKGTSKPTATRTKVITLGFKATRDKIRLHVKLELPFIGSRYSAIPYSAFYRLPRLSVRS